MVVVGGGGGNLLDGTRLGEALEELRATLVSEILETLAKVTPAFLETTVLDLLHKMGYGTSRSDLKRVGGSGDAGIDGVISLDKLGLDKVYVQAKRRFRASMALFRPAGFSGSFHHDVRVHNSGS